MANEKKSKPFTQPAPVEGAPRFLNREQARTALGCNEATLRKLIREGTIHEVQLGGLRRIPASELERLAAEAGA